MSLRKLADEFLVWCASNVGKDAFRWRKRALQSFCDYVGAVKAGDLTVRQVERWLESKAWKPNTKTSARGALQACLNWAVKRDMISVNPVKKLGIGSYTNAERILTAEERTRARAAVKDQQFKDYLRVLELTGARPFSEIATLIADLVDFENGVIVFERHKNAKKGKRRTVYLTPELTEILRRRVAARPEGLLFRTTHQCPIDSKNMAHRLRLIAVRASIKRFNAYAYRHSYTADALERGLTTRVVAELVGDSAKTIEKYYDYLSQKRDAMKDAALRAVS
ncbi:phage integrase family protein : Phage-related integrase OS=Blastopirellula marina DSM 3645 GN=DSM3645_03233 PE=4 SV=1: Phage_integrase [Gemmata massiliana]|uniref:Tyr recombinase domain-containing protein n=1 Tax=Gemmata massiliana TaxID=1210884 RepID=A0A6P2CVZ9_9BACT|nr:tyrosine-type recombinase/integrase [Gemmata massiliana]VTR93073.1 phage integrase family protein : Phage-related integrase OS=Blastopirellula marina DSM 3645 GN=DSM3645_03233 PE=4 SV=1: Phage_integrase [Gemmata massiliana]